MARIRQPPPGATITPTPLAAPAAGRNTVMVGSETLRRIAIFEPSSAGCRYEISARSGPLVGGPSGHSRNTSLDSVRVITSARASSAMALLSSSFSGHSRPKPGAREAESQTDEERAHRGVERLGLVEVDRVAAVEVDDLQRRQQACGLVAHRLEALLAPAVHQQGRHAGFGEALDYRKAGRGMT